jgi:hypothetical protein
VFSRDLPESAGAVSAFAGGFGARTKYEHMFAFGSSYCTIPDAPQQRANTGREPAKQRRWQPSNWPGTMTTCASGMELAILRKQNRFVRFRERRFSMFIGGGFLVLILIIIILFLIF